MITGEKAVPPPGYVKKIVNPGHDFPLSATFYPEQIEKRISFYRELNLQRERIVRRDTFIETRFALYGWDDTTTVRVYMRETVSKITAELFFSDYTLEVSNVLWKGADGRVDKDHGYVVITVRATEPEIDALAAYIHPGASYYVYDGEEAKYVAGDTASSEFIIVKPDEAVQPSRFWRRSQSFIARVETQLLHAVPRRSFQGPPSAKRSGSNTLGRGSSA